jgi:hypothetical protein
MGTDQSSSQILLRLVINVRLSPDDFDYLHYTFPYTRLMVVARRDQCERVK